MIRFVILLTVFASAANGWVLGNTGNTKAAFKQFSSAVGAAAVAASIAVAPVQAKNISQGEQLFQADCAQCHNAIKALPGDQTSLQKEAIKKFRGGTDQVTVKNYVQNQLPHSYMPFALKYNDKDYNDVASYIVQQAD